MTDIGPEPGPAPGRVAAPRSEPLPPVWLSHHHEHEADRCVRFGDTYVCRRCLAIYGAFVPALIAMLTVWRDQLEVGDVSAALVLTGVAAVDFVLVVRRRLPYSPLRVWLLSPAVGCVLAWLVVVGARDGFGAPHLALGGVAAALLLVLVISGSPARPER